MKELDQFFSKLAVRLRKEPALSDMTYTALETIPGFKNDFVQFFHPGLKCEGDVEVFREFPLKSGGQPDFCAPARQLVGFDYREQDLGRELPL